MPAFWWDEPGPGRAWCCWSVLSWSSCTSRCVHHPAQPLGAADTWVLGPIRTVMLARKPAPREVWMEWCFIQILSQQTWRLRERVSTGMGLVRASRWGVARCHAGRAKKRKNKWRELTAESLCMSQAACKGKCKFSNQFFQSCAALLKSFYWPCAQRNQSTPSLIWALYNQNQYFFSWL